MTTIQKLVAAGLLFAVWGGFALAGLTPVAGFINAVYAALVGLGVFHITMTNPAQQPDNTQSNQPQESPK